MKKALIAMSGGVDSSVAAHIIKNAGYECLGVTMNLHQNNDNNSCDKSCCTSQDISDAKNVASSLGIAHLLLDFHENFKEKVIDKFVNTYQMGGTPNPCIDCNRYLKFEKLLNYMNEIDYDYVVTGHYARIEKDTNRYLLKKGLDENKDQSYVLYSLTNQQLAHTLFPLGSFTKNEIREIASEINLINAQKKDSQDICFIPDKKYAEFIENYTGKTFKKGDFVSIDGKKLGTHKGIIRYTVGQRKGLGLSLPESLYVTEINPATNQVVLGKDEDLYKKSLDVTNINLIALDNINTPIKLTAKLRYKHKEAPCKVWQTDKNSLHIEFDEPQRAITKGQAAVLYDNDIVVGGGTII